MTHVLHLSRPMFGKLWSCHDFCCSIHSGFENGGSRFWSRRYAERIWGEVFYFGPANFRKIAGEFLSEV